MLDFPPPSREGIPRRRTKASGQLAPGIYTDTGVGETVRVVAVDATGARVFDGSMTREFFDEALRAGLFNTMECAIDAVCCGSPEFSGRTDGTMTDGPNGSAPRGD